MTVGVYGFVAAIVKLDDLGVLLVRKERGASRAIGAAILRGAPWLMKALSIGGTVAMFLVGGGILVHGVPGVEGWIHHVSERAGRAVELLLPLVTDGVVGVAAGALLVGLVALAKRLLPRRAPAG
jgi:predicted DNA repair protein MutK